jgi:bifunctional non-homologous end joining protein LigD
VLTLAGSPGIMAMLVLGSAKRLKDAVERMKPLFTDKSPFVNPPKIKEKTQWVQPKLVCEIEYAELTDVA